MTLWRMLFALAAAFAAGMSVKTLYEREKKLPQTLPGYSDGKDTRNTSHFDYLYLLLFIAVSAVMLLSERTQAQYSRLLTALIFEYLVVLSAYCLLLLLLLPALRRTISARACGRLWEIPAIVTFVILYLESIQNAAFVRLPMVIFYVPEGVLKGVFAVWFAGFVICLVWYLAAHIRFKKQLTECAREAEPTIQNLWREAIKAIGLNWNIPLYVTPAIHTPLVVGVRKRGMKAFLPDRSYTREELVMIFHHELRHVFRRDGEIKLMWMVIRSMLWFNPFARLAGQRAAEDLELSCDEFVLEGASDETRRRYAELLLDTAGDSRGFSTCLSASARTLRYRLKCAVKPGKRLPGALAVALAAGLLVMSVGTVSFAHGRGRLSDFYDFSGYTDVTDSFSRQIQKTIYGTYRIEPVGPGDLSYFGKRDDQTVIEYLSGLEVLALTKPFDSEHHFITGSEYFGNGQWAGFELYDPQKDTVLWIQLWEDWLVVQSYSPRNTQYYKVPGGIDWTWLNTMLGPAEE
ncbi:MAG: M56 family metallopeptidase [Clostridia bacterium]|nr:M56 family metallopeptidase [Clostridia bacterium]